MQWRLDMGLATPVKELRAALEKERGLFLSTNCSEESPIYVEVSGQLDSAIEAACTLTAKLIGKVRVSLAGHGPGHLDGIGSRFSVSIDEVLAESVPPAPPPPAESAASRVPGVERKAA